MNREHATSGFDFFRLGACVFLVVLLFGFLDFRVAGVGAYNEGSTVPLITPHGIDFHAVYEYGAALRKGLDEYLAIPNIYPPLVTVSLLPLTFLNPNGAYKVYTAILLCALFALVFVLLRMTRSKRDAAFFALIATAVLFQTYPVNFSLERGNSDIIAAAFAAISLVSMTRGYLWLSVLALTISVQFKVYPLILGIFLFARLGWKSVAYFAICNLFSMFVLAGAGFEKFVSSLYQFASTPYMWPGNHSIHSMLHYIGESGRLHGVDQVVLRKVLYVLVLVLFAGLALPYVFPRLKQWRAVDEGVVERGFTGFEIGLIGMSFTLMSLLPSVGHDYKLVIHLVPFIIFLSQPWQKYSSDSPKKLALIVCVLSVSVATLFLPRVALAPFRLLGFNDTVAQMKTPSLLVIYFVYCGFTVMNWKAIHNDKKA